MMHNRDMLVVSILTVITVMAWIVFDVYHASISSTLTDIQESMTTTLNPKLNSQVLNRMRQ